MSNLLLPDYVGASSSTSSRGNARRSTLRRTEGRTYRRTLAGEGAIIPDGYGRIRLPARIPTVTRYGGDLLLLCVWMSGPIDAIEQVRIGGETFNGQANHYTGAGNVVDPWLQAAINGYGDALVGRAYSVLRLTNADRVSQTIEAQLRGRLVYDPRTDTTAYSANAALCLAHYIAARTSRAMDWPSVADTADVCDELLSDGNPRRHIGLPIEQPAPIADWIETLREYAGCYIVWDDPVRLIPDRPRPVDHVIGPDKIREINPRKRRLDDAPNRVVVEYTKIDGDTWTTGRAATPYPTGQQLREQRVRLDGIQRHAHADRQATERLNRYTLADLEGDMIVRDEGLTITAGDRLSVTHPIGLTDKSVRVTADPEAVEPGRWRVPFEEYDEGIYSDSIETEPSSPDTNLPDPFSVPAGPEPTLTEEVYQLQNGDYASRIRATWPATDYPYDHRYRVEVTDNTGALVWSAETGATGYVTGAIQEGTVYTVSVSVLGFAGIEGTATSEAITAQGKFLIPGDVPQLSARQVGADAVKAQWQQAIDIDIYRYELRRGAVGVAWDDAEIVDQVDGLQARIEELPIGDYDMLVRALDSVRQYSPNTTRTTVTVAPPVAPASITAFEVGGEVRLAWPEGSGYIESYALRYGSPGDTWAQANQLDRVRALRYVTREIPPGEHRVFIRAVDAAGNLSPGEASTTVVVTLDTEAFLADSHQFTGPTLTNMASWAHRPEGGAPTYYVTEMDETPASLWPDPMDTYTRPLADYHATGDSEWLSEAWDIGAEFSGTWQVDVALLDIASTAAISLELSSDGSTWSTHGSSVKASARYARVRITTSATMRIIADPGVRVRLDVIPREETGRTTSVASGATTVNLKNEYTLASSIQITPQGTESMATAFDNVVLTEDQFLEVAPGRPLLTNGGQQIRTQDQQYSFDAYIFDQSGAQIARDFHWQFKGV